MKRIVAILAAAVLVFALPMTVMAASPSTDKNDTNASTVSVRVEAIEGADADQVVVDTQYTDSAAAKAALADNGAAAMTQAGVDKSVYSLYTVMDIHLKSGAAFNGKAVVDFVIKGLTATSNAKVLHYENGAWKDVTTGVGTDYVQGTFTTFSPIMIVMDKAALAAVSAGNTNSGKTSPSTGEAPVSAALMAVAAAAAAGIVLSLKKKRA